VPRPALRSWPFAAGAAAAGGLAAGCFLPWVTVFGGLEGFPGTRGSNGRLLAAAGILAAAAGLWYLLGGGTRSRWIAGPTGSRPAPAADPVERGRAAPSSVPWPAPGRPGRTS
jgi:hypothetical protein